MADDSIPKSVRFVVLLRPAEIPSPTHPALDEALHFHGQLLALVGLQDRDDLREEQRVAFERCAGGLPLVREDSLRPRFQLLGLLERVEERFDILLFVSAIFGGLGLVLQEDRVETLLLRGVEIELAHDSLDAAPREVGLTGVDLAGVAWCSLLLADVEHDSLPLRW